jgi:DNA-binding SARP family transcriptional activator
MWFGVLGPLLVRHEDVVVDVPAARHRALLAALLLRAGTIVPADTLAEMVWDGAPPPGAEATLRSHVSRLRQVLGPDVAARVVTRYRGYLIEAGEEEVDLLRFRGLCRKGAAAARNGDWARAWEWLEEALGLWRGAAARRCPWRAAAPRRAAWP